MSKIFENLILGHILDLSKRNNVDIISKNQHGFKSERITVTAALKVQSTIASALDQNNYSLQVIKIEIRT